jgi:2-oxoglutarate dehydrogenase complex dehydrogenase (E1) component-like enzyme
VTIEVDDPGAFTRPWKGTAEYRQNRSADQVAEMVCAENNRDFAEGSTFGTIPQEKTPPF